MPAQPDCPSVTGGRKPARQLPWIQGEAAVGPLHQDVVNAVAVPVGYENLPRGREAGADGFGRAELSGTQCGPVVELPRRVHRHDVPGAPDGRRREVQRGRHVLHQGLAHIGRLHGSRGAATRRSRGPGGQRRVAEEVHHSPHGVAVGRGLPVAVGEGDADADHVEPRVREDGIVRRRVLPPFNELRGVAVPTDGNDLACAVGRTQGARVCPEVRPVFNDLAGRMLSDHSCAMPATVAWYLTAGRPRDAR